MSCVFCGFEGCFPLYELIFFVQIVDFFVHCLTMSRFFYLLIDFCFVTFALQTDKHGEQQFLPPTTLYMNFCFECRSLTIFWCSSQEGCQHEFLETCPSVTFYFLKNSFSDISKRWILPNIIRVGIHLLLISENEFFMK